jgi:hypothetical protein
MRGSRVRDEMRQQLQIATQMPELKAAPQNEQTVAAQELQRAGVARELNRIRAEIRRINGRELLLPDAFTAGAPKHLPYRFAELYREAFDRLLTQLHAGSLPDDADIAAAQLDIAEQMAFEREKEDELAVPGASLSSPRPASNLPGARDLATALKARSIRCYADHGSFDLAPACVSAYPPSVEEMWFAQVGLWIQQDVVAAIVKLNEDATHGKPTSASVEQMPVKRIFKIYVLGYRCSDGLLPFPAPDVPRNNGRLRYRPSFTGRACDDLCDVVLFRIIVIVDQRDVLGLIDRLTKQNLFRCTSAAYSAVPPGDAAAGYRYGGEPAIAVALEFEAYLATEIYHPLMPAEVRALLRSTERSEAQISMIPERRP